MLMVVNTVNVLKQNIVLIIIKHTQKICLNVNLFTNVSYLIKTE